MGRSPFQRAAVLVAAASLLVAACGDDDTTTSAGDTMETAADRHDHSHDEGIEIGDADEIPTVAVTATPDPKSGVNLHVETTGITFAPEHASTEHVPGEGHAHVYVDGDKYGRLYGEWMYLDVEPGEHEIRVDLNANDRSPLLVDGEPIDDVVTVDVPEPAEMDHSHDEGFEAAEPHPTVSLTVTEDPRAGWNVRVETTGYTFAPEKASTMETESGEGHAHLYVDGRKVTRLYGEWYHFGGVLATGEHDFRVELSANDHSTYLAGGQPIEAVQTVTVEGAPEAVEADQVIEVAVDGGSVEGGGRQSVALGSTVAIVVASDVADEVHVHGYDVYGAVDAGGTATVTFTADIPGVFEVELEEAGLPVVELEVS